MTKLLASILVCMLLMNCNNSIEEEPFAQKKKTLSNRDELIVVLYLKDSIVSENSEIQVTARFYNNAEMDVKMNEREVLENPILSLHISDEKGNEIHTIPPSIPKDEKSSMLSNILKSKENHTVKYNLNIFNPALSKGRYCITMRGVTSNKIWFEIK